MADRAEFTETPQNTAFSEERWHRIAGGQFTYRKIGATNPPKHDFQEAIHQRRESTCKDNLASMVSVP